MKAVITKTSSAIGNAISAMTPLFVTALAFIASLKMMAGSTGFGF